MQILRFTSTILKKSKKKFLTNNHISQKIKVKIKIAYNYQFFAASFMKPTSSLRFP